jgi:hypothetical protein
VEQNEDSKKLVMPPLVPDGKNGDRYDSVKGKQGASDIYMVYSNRLCIPEYLLTYIS